MEANANMKLNTMKKKFTIGEEISHAITHGIGSLLGVVGLVILLVQGSERNTLYMVSMAIYGGTLILLYSNSSIYHALTHKKAKFIFEKMDHLSIYCLIAGTYTPYMLIAVGGTKGIVICAIQWGLAGIGIVLKAIWIKRYQKIHLMIYLAMGWMIVFFSGAIRVAITDQGFLLLVLGGLAYSIGVLFYAFRWFKYHHLVWHIFVLAGSILHFFSILLYV
ncbi:MAG: hemolysin III family protein [Vallitaleaceae bacterium]|nr:hemolysin III family protein [Vallitaleaceae bacterium]